MARRKKSPVSVILVLLICGLVWCWQNRDILSGERNPRADGVPPAADSGEPAVLTGGYERFEGCRLVDYRNNDGDSFKVRFPDGGEREMRLYFVDAPESAVKEYRDGNSNRKRIAYQGKDLGGMSERETVAIGQEAKKVAREVLQERPFTVLTKWQEVYDSGRYYGFIEIEDSGRTLYLHELLVDRGLARIYTEGAKLPDGTSRGGQERKLREREKKARAARVGAWRN